MNIQSLYMVASTALLLFIAMAWSRKGFLNFAIKGTFVAFGLLGVVMTLAHFGYIIKA